MTTGQPIEATDDWFGRVRCTTATHPGMKRGHNEDALLSRPDLGLWVVADGAGGHSCGDVAARMVVAALDAIPPNLTAGEMLAQVRLRLAGTHHMLRNESTRIQQRIVASTVVVLIVRDNHFACLWAGDSRAYLLREGKLAPLTVDHSLVQDLLDRGEIDPAVAEQHPQSHVITRAIGADGADPELDKTIGTVMAGDRFLLCSDGLCKTLAVGELAQLLRAGASAEQIVSATLALDVSDNVTGLTVHFQAASD
jgi:protein phosphatase/serine/threonine-protein phosphatase Stp1